MNGLDFLVSLGFSISSIDEDLLLQSLTHKSYAMDFPVGEVDYNERLEFLGDAILGAVIARLLFDNFPDLAESNLTLSKIFLVKEETLAKVARNIKLGTAMRIGVGEERSGGRDKNAVLSDGLEALIAFIYLQFGRESIEEFIQLHIYTLLGDEPVMPMKSRKNQLQELIQKFHNEIPVYEDKALETSSSGDIKLFGSSVFVLGVYICMGQGVNKKKAQEDGAQQAMQLIKIIDDKLILPNGKS